jgi:diguanylate cyclase (GGDEF)-like protein
MFLDLDGFKDVNDTLGRCRRPVAVRSRGRLRECVRGDSLCRLGGDGLRHHRKRDASRRCHRAAERIVKALARRFCSGHEVKATASMGVAVYPDDGAKKPTLIKNADVAMYRAKQNGRNRFHVFSTVKPCRFRSASLCRL